MAAAPGQSAITGLIPIVAMVLIFYFLLIAPVRKRQRQHDDLVANLKNGDKVVTSGGLYGTVVGIQDDRFRLKIADQVKVDVTKQSIAGLAEGSD